MKQYRLAIVQSHATQFDAPLYCRISRHNEFDLAVYYTKPGKETPFDAEIGRKAAWDHLTGSGYRYEARMRGFRNAFRFLKRIKSGQHDLVVISGYSSWYYLLAAVYLRLKDVPVGLRSDTTLESARSGAKSIVKRLVMPWIMKLYSTGHPTGSLAGKYLAHYGLGENRQFRFPYAVDNDKDYEDLWLMSLCKYFIIANSTFSWWGAWLSSFSDKVVFAPSQGFSNTVNLIPEDWKII